MFYNRLLFIMLLVAGPSVTTSAHIHINMIPAGSSAGSPLSIGFYGNEPGDDLNIIDTGQRLELHYSDGSGFSLYTVTADTLITDQYQTISEGFLAGMRRGAILNFTADGIGSAPLVENPNTSTPPIYDRLIDGTGKPVGYEIASVIDAATGLGLDAAYRVQWRLIRGPASQSTSLRLPDTFSGYDTFTADSGAYTRAGRSYLVRAGAHSHGNANYPDSGFFLFTDAPLGEYDITLVAWDVEGYFADSQPLTFRLNVVPEPTSLALLGAGACVLIRRRR